MPNLKKIAPTHTTNCTYCKSEGTKQRAVWRLTHSNYTACEGHKEVLVQHMEAYKRVSSREYTEADYQTWMRL